MRWSKEHERSCTWRWTGRWPCRSGRARFRWPRRNLMIHEDFWISIPKSISWIWESQKGNMNPISFDLCFSLNITFRNPIITIHHFLFTTEFYKPAGTFWMFFFQRKSESIGNTIYRFTLSPWLASMRLSCASVQRAQLEETSNFQIRPTGRRFSCG